MGINREPHNWSTCREQKTAENSVLIGIFISHPRLLRLRDYCRSGSRKTVKARVVDEYRQTVFSRLWYEFFLTGRMDQMYSTTA